MRTRTFLLPFLIFAFACGSSDGTSVIGLRAPVVYGDDDRREVYAHPDEELRRIARESIVALIKNERIERLPSGDYALDPKVLQDDQGLCEDELFGNQPVAATCSGTLIDDDLVLTAGHCISISTPCDSFSYVFNYHLEGPNALAAIRDEDVYSCNRVLLEGDPFGTAKTPDFAIIELDRPVEGAHGPVAIRPASVVPEGEPLAMIGFGSGLPAKIDTGAAVADDREEFLDYFVANLDAFQGHSGSATFDSNDQLAGILIDGRIPDYVPDLDAGCRRVNVFLDEQAWESVHNVAPIIGTLCDEGLGSDALCDPEACDGAPCGVTPPQGAGGNSGGGPSGVVPVSGSGCSAATGGNPSPSIGLLLLLLVMTWGRGHFSRRFGLEKSETRSTFRSWTTVTSPHRSPTAGFRSRIPTKSSPET